ncbi:hypothetical protein ACFODZ_08595 [Marinicella sediminis]|uniref:DUF4760 domain-containing protein n=1 Tax=Marinicella sediminis TaxID=1792834 RepID=A0ABV7J868_9GAMM|nr:hypothetical protein [Marinicella sediminis]
MNNIDELDLTVVMISLMALFVSWQSLISRKRSSEASLVVEFLKEYSSPEMSRSLRLLREYRDSNINNFASKWLKDLRVGNEEAKEVDLARRKVSHYFYRGYKLYKSGYVSKKFIRSVMLVDGIAIYLEINKQLEMALGALPTQDEFSFYDAENHKNYYVRRVFRYLD